MPCYAGGQALLSADQTCTTAADVPAAVSTINPPPLGTLNPANFIDTTGSVPYVHVLVLGGTIYVPSIDPVYSQLATNAISVTFDVNTP